MSNAPEKKAEAKFHPYAECMQEECGWKVGQSPGARDSAKSHVRSHGHRVRVVIEQVAVWGPKDD
jgi:hypothetical protein